MAISRPMATAIGTLSPRATEPASMRISRISSVA